MLPSTPVSLSEGSPEGTTRQCSLLKNIRQVDTHPGKARPGDALAFPEGEGITVKVRTP